MAQFYGEITGNRGTATRMGGKDSGFYAHIRGWDMGIRVQLAFNDALGRDEATVYLTGGSNGRSIERLIGRFAKGRKIHAASAVPRKIRVKLAPPIAVGLPRKVEEA